ncbi:MAG: hypothetical protein VB862_18730, partial [Pirellulaceae bacterium]
MSRFHPFPTTLCSLLVASTMLLTGCQPQQEPDPQPQQEPDPQPQLEPDPQPQQEPDPQPQPDKPRTSSDIWTVALIDGNKIGYSHLEQTEVTDNGQTYQKHHHVSELTLQRSASITRQRTELT